MVLRGTKTRNGVGIARFATCSVCGRRYKQSLGKVHYEGAWPSSRRVQNLWPQGQCGAHLRPKEAQ